MVKIPSAGPQFIRSADLLEEFGDYRILGHRRKIVELHLEGEATHDRRVEILAEVGRDRA